MTRPPKRTLPRSVAIFLPPVAALLLAAVYTTWQARAAATAASALCAKFKSGDSLDSFMKFAREADFELFEGSPGSLSLTAAKDVYRWERESYRCTAYHDGGEILSTEATMVTLTP